MTRQRKITVVSALAMTARLALSFVLAWTCVHFITLGSPRWGAGSRHDATILGQMIAVLLFPALLLIAFGNWRKFSGPIFVSSIGVIFYLLSLVQK